MIDEEAQPTIHHIAYLVADTQLAMAAMTRLATPTEYMRRPLESQKAFITFLKCGEDAPLIELVEPFENNIAMRRKIKSVGQDSILHHIGYKVTDFDNLRASMRRDGWLPLSAPFKGFDKGCRALHFFNPVFGVVELMERLGSSAKASK